MIYLIIEEKKLTVAKNLLLVSEITGIAKDTLYEHFSRNKGAKNYKFVRKYKNGITVVRFPNTDYKWETDSVNLE